MRQKKRNSDRELWRQSWGSAHSQSSCSVHSNAATASNTGLSQSGKDDFWAALQTNYNYIMDTNLLDTCKEARCELLNGAGAAHDGRSVAAGVGVEGGNHYDASPIADGPAAAASRKKTTNNADNDNDDESCDDCAKVRVCNCVHVTPDANVFSCVCVCVGRHVCRRSSAAQQPCTDQRSAPIASLAAQNGAATRRSAHTVPSEANENVRSATLPAAHDGE